MAAYALPNLRAQVDAKNPGIAQAEFADGEIAGNSARSWYDGSLYISHRLTPEQLDVVVRDAARVQGEVKRGAGSGPGDRRIDAMISETGGTQNPSSVVWGVKGYGALVRSREHALLWRSAGDLEQSARAFQAVVGQFRVRQPLTSPAAQGICLPYTFIADDGSVPRDIRSTYRPLETPDIQIMLKDATAAVHEPGNRSRNNEPEPFTVNFWSQLLTQAKEVKPLWSPSTRPVKLAGYAGLASLVQLTREDGTIDFGYLAVVRGDPKAKEDSPDLMLYIVQDGKRALAKGKEPVSRDAFFSLAERIASSVQRRVVAVR
jgi:hypothetical protein